MNRRWTSLFLAPLLASVAWAGDAATDWQAILALDAGPGGEARNVAAARAAASQHLTTQENALRRFIAAYPQDANAFEARLRLARLLEIRGSFEGSEKARIEAKRMLDDLAKTATPEQQVEVDFAQVTRLMRGAQKTAKERREQILTATRKFYTAHPGDRRMARLLVEVAALFDSQPKVKISLLNEANAATTDPELKQRIADDLRRLDLLGHPLPLSFTSLSGKEVKIEDFRGRPVLVVFFADFSPPSTEALAQLQRVIAELPKDSVAAIGVSLDPRRESLDSVIASTRLTWPVAFDGKSWEGPLVRSLGINTLPTVYVLLLLVQLVLLCLAPRPLDARSRRLRLAGPDSRPPRANRPHPSHRSTPGAGHLAGHGHRRHRQHLGVVGRHGGSDRHDARNRGGARPRVLGCHGQRSRRHHVRGLRRPRRLRRAGLGAGPGAGRRRNATDAARSCGTAGTSPSPDTMLGDSQVFWQVPIWTDGCITSADNVRVDSSMTAPAMQMTKTLVSQSVETLLPGRPNFELNIAGGVTRMRALGIRYYLTRGEQPAADAAKSKALTLVAQGGPWEMWEVDKSVEGREPDLPAGRLRAAP